MCFRSVSAILGQFSAIQTKASTKIKKNKETESTPPNPSLKPYNPPAPKLPESPRNFPRISPNLPETSPESPRISPKLPRNFPRISPNLPETSPKLPPKIPPSPPKNAPNFQKPVIFPFFDIFRVFQNFSVNFYFRFFTGVEFLGKGVSGWVWGCVFGNMGLGGWVWASLRVSSLVMQRVWGELGFWGSRRCWQRPLAGVMCVCACVFERVTH